MEKQKFKTNVIIEIAIFAAIALALDFLQGGLWRGVFVNGGSIGLAMIPVLIMGYRRGFIAGLVTGLIVSLLQMMGGIYVISNSWYNALLQISLDYLLTYPVIALCAIFRKPFMNAENTKQKLLYLSLGTLIGGLGKFLMHFLAGILFWKNFDFKGGYVLYSLVYNGGYMLPNIIIAIIIMIVLYLKAPKIIVLESEANDEKE